MASYGELYRLFEHEVELYERLVERVKEILVPALKEREIVADVKGRVKEPHSFATKALLKGYSNPMQQIGDKAGVRITLIYAHDVEAATTVVREQLHVIRTESKLDALEYNTFGYLGVHCDARLNDSDQGIQTEPGLQNCRVEIQVRTMVQSAWAEVSHEQLYKPPADVPDELKRRIFRLVALVELFDSEVTRFVEAAQATPGYKEAVALVPLAQVLLERFDVRQRPDRQLSLLVAAAVVPLYGGDPGEVYDRHLESWIAANVDALQVQFDEARALPTNPLYLQPESFLLFERLSNDQARLEAHWPSELPRVWLDELAAGWGVQRD